MKKSLFDTIVEYCDAYRIWAISRPLRREKDPEKKFEIKLWLEISGAFMGGQGRDGAWESYKLTHYDKASKDDKIKIQNSLLKMLKSEQYDIFKKAFIAQACADIYLCDALPIVNELIQQTDDNRAIRELRSAHEALSRGITMYELVKERFLSGKRNEIGA